MHYKKEFWFYEYLVLFSLLHQWSKFLEDSEKWIKAEWLKKISFYWVVKATLGSISYIIFHKSALKIFPLPWCEDFLIVFLPFSFDLRSQSESGKHWKDDRTLGNRGYVFYEEIPHSCKSYLNIEPVIAGDSGQYRCRVDYEISPTRNTRIKLKLIGKAFNVVVLCNGGLFQYNLCRLGPIQYNAFVFVKVANTWLTKTNSFQSREHCLADGKWILVTRPRVLLQL